MHIVRKKGNLIDCGAANGFTGPELDEIRAISEKNKEVTADGFEAITLSVSQLIDGFDKQRQSVITQLRAQLPDAEPVPVIAESKPLEVKAPAAQVTETVEKPVTILPPKVEHSPIDSGNYTFDTHKDIQSRIIDGDITPVKLKDAFEAFAANKDTIKAELLKNYDAKTLKKMERGYYPGKTKGESASNIVGQLESDFVLGGGVSYSPFSGEKYIDAVRKLVDGYTEKDISEYAAKMADLRAR